MREKKGGKKEEAIVYFTKLRMVDFKMGSFFVESHVCVCMYWILFNVPYQYILLSSLCELLLQMLIQVSDHMIVLHCPLPNAHLSYVTDFSPLFSKSMIGVLFRIIQLIILGISDFPLFHHLRNSSTNYITVPLWMIN